MIYYGRTIYMLLSEHIIKWLQSKVSVSQIDKYIN